MKNTRAEEALPKNSPTKRVGSGRLVRRPVVRRGEYWVFALIDPAGKLIGNTWGAIMAKTFEVPATLEFKDRAPGLFESAKHGVVEYRQPNSKLRNAANG